MISHGPQRGLLLPQVATEYGWTRERFLEETCLKAGLDADAWKKGARVEAFTACVFSEASLAAPMEYTGFVWAALLGVLLFGEVPTATQLISAALIVGGCLLLVRR